MSKKYPAIAKRAGMALHLSEEYKEGVQAFRDNLKLDDNPYAFLGEKFDGADQHHHAAWYYGWSKAKNMIDDRLVADCLRGATGTLIHDVCSLTSFYKVCAAFYRKPGLSEERYARHLHNYEHSERALRIYLRTKDLKQASAYIDAHWVSREKKDVD